MAMDGDPRAVLHQAAAFLRQVQSTRISALSHTLGYSSRQMQRRINNSVGLPARQLKRILRFEQVLGKVSSSPQGAGVDWAAIAFSCGYSDQAHLIRDFHEFSGQTPSVYLKSIH